MTSTLSRSSRSSIILTFCILLACNCRPGWASFFFPSSFTQLYSRHQDLQHSKRSKTRCCMPLEYKIHYTKATHITHTPIQLLESDNTTHLRTERFTTISKLQDFKFKEIEYVTIKGSEHTFHKLIVPADSTNSHNIRETTPKWIKFYRWATKSHCECNYMETQEVIQLKKQCMNGKFEGHTTLGWKTRVRQYSRNMLISGGHVFSITSTLKCGTRECVFVSERIQMSNKGGSMLQTCDFEGFETRVKDSEFSIPRTCPEHCSHTPRIWT
uniref:Uncharacterized protein n=1 Tax=Percolomonas cosmopolitus TaxID=63605 RepID=A0A7S1KSV6_9EUKA|mmetsp:Transcript_5729/g.21715  ORF Transcript_5729/g.21715 Transcript_5729/m.21715 type:complete len:270 (+) Transcript_5729:690-1499(+)